MCTIRKLTPFSNLPPRNRLLKAIGSNLYQNATAKQREGGVRAVYGVETSLKSDKISYPPRRLPITSTRLCKQEKAVPLSPQNTPDDKDAVIFRIFPEKQEISLCDDKLRWKKKKKN